MEMVWVEMMSDVQGSHLRSMTYFEGQPSALEFIGGSVKAQGRIGAAVLGMSAELDGVLVNCWSPAVADCLLLQLSSASGLIQQVPAGLPWSN